MTVTGPMQVENMGLTLTHEHIMVDFIGADSTGYHRWNREDVIKSVLPPLKKVKKKGLQTLVECTPAYLGRDPRLLKNISQKTNIQLITNTGYYGAVDEKFLPKHAFEESAEQLAKRWIAEWENGIEDTDIKPGFIKISVGSDSELSDVHEKLVRAAAKTHLETGLTIASHTGPEDPAFAQLNVLEEEGVSPEAFIWVHAQNGNTEAQIKAAEKGAWISLDGVQGKKKIIENYVQMLSNLKEHNLLHRALISHDAGWYSPGEPNGGDFRPYTPIFDQLVPALENKGFTREEIDRLLKENPKKAFVVEKKILK
ncbi:MAG: hypothetical protein K9H65_02695 [Bacteroidales bacterium]|nr:hypothetical protein [Bacteroidales bacterium]